MPEAPKLDNTITISLDNGAKFMSLMFRGKADHAQRYFVDVFQEVVSIKPMPMERFAFTSADLAKLIAEPGAIGLSHLPAIIEAAARRLNTA